MTAAVTDLSPSSMRPRRRSASLPRLASVELRKMTDTRAGIALLGITAAIAVAMMFILAFTADGVDATWSRTFSDTLGPVTTLLPVLGILAVTSEWSQRTALTTFTLVPRRFRVMSAKLVAVVVLAVAAVAVSLLTSAVATLIAGSQPGQSMWSLSGSALGTGLLAAVLNMVIGLAFGLLLQSSPMAIVAYFLAPTIVGILTGTVDVLSGPLGWVDLSTTTGYLLDAHIGSAHWARLGVSVALWLGVPVVLGLARLARHEVK